MARRRRENDPAVWPLKRHPYGYIKEGRKTNPESTGFATVHYGSDARSLTPLLFTPANRAQAIRQGDDWVDGLLSRRGAAAG